MKIQDNHTEDVAESRNLFTKKLKYAVCHILLIFYLIVIVTTMSKIFMISLLFHLETSFRTLSLVHCSRFLPMQHPEVVDYHVDIPLTLVPLFQFLYVLVESLSFFLTGSA